MRVDRSRFPTSASDTGSAVVDFALVGGLLTLLFMAVVQLGLMLHVRNTVIDCVAEGARYGALAGHGPSDATARVRELLASELGPGYASRTGIVRASESDVEGVPVVELTVLAPVPLVGLAGPAGALTITGHAVAEQR